MSLATETSLLACLQLLAYTVSGLHCGATVVLKHVLASAILLLSTIRNINKALGFTQLLTEMSTRNIKIIMFLGSKVRLVRRADNLTAIYEPIV
jgi:hypothetical protein